MRNGLKTLFVLLLILGAAALFILWIAKSEDSDFARSARQFIGIPEPHPEVDPAAPERAPIDASAQPEPSEPSEPQPKPEVIREELPPAISDITFEQVASRKQLWPRQLSLKLNVAILIRYNGNDYGLMKFPRGRTVQVESLMRNGEILCLIDGNYLSLSVYETDFYGWFKEKHGASYQLLPVTVDFGSSAKVRHKLGTPQGDAAFWAEMREWCYRNYDSPSLVAEEHGLVFKWVPKEKVPINFVDEAREIARQYLLRRAKYGGRENYAPCEIRNPVTGEFLGAAAIFIPRL